MNTASYVRRGGFVRRGSLLLAMLGIGVFCAWAGSAPAEIRWNELAALIVGNEVTIPLTGGAVVAGEVLSVRDDSIMLEIRKTSDRIRYPKGQTPIPRAVVSEVRLLERRGMGGRVLGSVVGALVGIAAGVEIAIHGPNSEAAGVTTFTAVAVAGSVGGYYAGRSADRRTKVLHVAPLPAKTGSE